MIDSNSISHLEGNVFEIYLEGGFGWGFVTAADTPTQFDVKFPEKLSFCLNRIHFTGQSVGVLFGKIQPGEELNGLSVITLLARFDPCLPFNDRAATYFLYISDSEALVTDNFLPPDSRSLEKSGYPFIYGYGAFLSLRGKPGGGGTTT
jgi:hypothetical protein